MSASGCLGPNAFRVFKQGGLAVLDLGCPSRFQTLMLTTAGPSSCPRVISSFSLCTQLSHVTGPAIESTGERRKPGVESRTHAQKHNEICAFGVGLEGLLHLQLAIQKRNAAVCASCDNNISARAAAAGSFREFVLALEALLEKAKLLPPET